MGVSVCELVAEHWRNVGVRADLKPLLRDLLFPRRVNGEFDIHVWELEGAADPLAYMNDWGILSPTGPFWHHNAMREGPDWLWKATEHVRGAMTTVDTTQLRVHMTALARPSRGERAGDRDRCCVPRVGSEQAAWECAEGELSCRCVSGMGEAGLPRADLCEAVGRPAAEGVPSWWREPGFSVQENGRMNPH